MLESLWSTHLCWYGYFFIYIILLLYIIFLYIYDEKENFCVKILYKKSVIDNHNVKNKLSSNKNMFYYIRKNKSTPLKVNLIYEIVSHRLRNLYQILSFWSQANFYTKFNKTFSFIYFLHFFPFKIVTYCVRCIFTRVKINNKFLRFHRSFPNQIYITHDTSVSRDT